MSELTMVKEFTAKITLSERDQEILRLVVVSGAAGRRYSKHTCT